jgi:uncharacterized protein (TIGR02231 family)
VPDNSTIDAPIAAVTVFTDGARIQRRGSVHVDAGQRNLVLGGLPAAVDPASVRVAVRGHDVALLNVEVHRRFRTDPLRSEVGRLRADVDACRDAVQELDDHDRAEQARLAFLDHLSDAAATALARSVGFGRASHDDLTQMASHLTADTGSALGRRREISARRRAAQRELEAAEERLAAAENLAGEAIAATEISVTVEAAASTQAELDLTYHLSGASWRPLYDVTLDGDRLAVSYLAEITQQTEEDWPAVELVLSTTRRGLRQILPELSPWYIRRAQPVAHPLAASAGPQLARMAMAPQAAAGRLAPSPEAQLAAEPVETSAGQAYRVARPLAVPADGGPHTTLIGRFELDARLDFLTVPVLAAEAYARATAINDSSLLLLPGPARIFRGTQFAGQTALETVAAGEEFELQLGVDDQVRVERELRRRTTTKAVLGGTRTIDIGYEITIENHRPGSSKVSVHDHIPLSADGDIRVRLRETSPDPAEQTDLGELSWDLTLDSGETAAIRYRFTVEHPAQVTVAGL